MVLLDRTQPEMLRRFYGHAATRLIHLFNCRDRQKESNWPAHSGHSLSQRNSDGRAYRNDIAGDTIASWMPNIFLNTSLVGRAVQSVNAPVRQLAHLLLEHDGRYAQAFENL